MGRAKGGIIVGVRCEIKIEGVEVCEEGIAIKLSWVERRG